MDRTGLKLVLGFFLCDLIDIGSSDHTGGESDYSHSHEGRNHGDELSYFSCGNYVSVADGGYGDGCPIQCVKKGFKEIGLQLKN